MFVEVVYVPGSLYTVNVNEQKEEKDALHV